MFAEAEEDLNKLKPLLPIQRTGVEELSDWEGVKEAFDYQLSVESSYARTGNLHDAYEDYIERIEAQTGEKIANPYRSRLGEFLIEDVALGLVDEAIKNPLNPESSRNHPKNVAAREQNNLNEFYAKLDKLKEKYPNLEYKTPENINEEIRTKVQNLYQRRNGGTTSSWWSGLIGDVAGAGIDPINLTASLLTGGANTARLTLGKALMKTAAYEAGVNALTETGIQMANYGYKKEMGLNPTFAESAQNVAFAGAGGAILGVALKGTGRAVSALKNKFQRLSKNDTLSLDDKIVLALKAEADDFMAATNPNPNDFSGLSDHTKNFLREQALIENESKQISSAYDKVLNNPLGKSDDPLVTIKPEDMDGIVMERGEFYPYNGQSKAGYGLVKFIWKHGEKSQSEFPVMKADVMDFPRIVRKYEPLTNNRFGDTRHWIVKNEQGYQIIYAARKMQNKDFAEVVTIYVGEDNERNIWRGIYSKEKDIAGKPSVHTKDTTQEPYYRTNESLANASAPESRFQGGGDVNENIIPQDWQKVNDDELDSWLDAKIAETDIDLPDDTVDGVTFSAKEKISSLKREKNYLDEVNACILEFGNE